MAEGPSADPHFHHELAPTTTPPGRCRIAPVRTASVAVGPLAWRPGARSCDRPGAAGGLVDELPGPERVKPFIEHQLLPLILTLVEPGAARTSPAPSRYREETGLRMPYAVEDVESVPLP